MGLEFIRVSRSNHPRKLSVLCLDTLMMRPEPVYDLRMWMRGRSMKFWEIVALTGAACLGILHVSMAGGPALGEEYSTELRKNVKAEGGLLNPESGPLTRRHFLPSPSEEKNAKSPVCGFQCSSMK